MIRWLYGKSIEGGCAWDTNQGLQYGRRRRIRREVTPNVIFLKYCSGSFSVGRRIIPTPEVRVSNPVINDFFRVTPLSLTKKFRDQLFLEFRDQLFLEFH